jgi:hypothetical protein
MGLENPGVPPPGFPIFAEAALRRPHAPPYSSALMLGSCVGDCEARADCQRGELIDRIAAGAPVRQLLFGELLRHARGPFAGHRPGWCLNFFTADFSG